MKKFICSFLTITVISTIIYSCNKAEPTVQGAAPTISSFSPMKDSAGGIVTITGSNFSSTISNNEVRFNNTPATIVSATTTTLKVTVPNGVATTSTITVKTSGQSATSATSFKLASPLELLIVGKWFYKSSIISDTEYVSDNNNQIITLSYPFMDGQNSQTYFDSSSAFLTFNENGISTFSRYAWGLGQSGIIYRDSVSYNQVNNNIYLNFPAGVNNYSSPGFSYPAYQDTLIVNSISQHSLVIFRRYHQKHYSNTNHILNKKLSLDSLVRY